MGATPQLQVDEQSFDYAEVLAFWKFLGVRDSLAKDLSEVNVRWEGGGLRCNIAVMRKEDPVGYIGCLVLSLYRIRAFSASRFLGMGHSCQGLSAAFAVGLDSHMAYVRSLPEHSEYYMGSYDLLDPEARLFIVKTAVAANCTDHLHYLLLADDRVAKDPPKYTQGLFDMIRKVNSDAPTLLFERLALHVPGADATALESDVLRACYCAAGYIDRRVFSEVRKPVYQLCCGDISGKVDALIAAGAPLPQDKTLQKAQRLGRLGFPKSLIVQAFELIAEAPWSILRLEQMHGVGAAQKKLHSQYGAPVLASKAAAQMMLPMVRRDDRPKGRTLDEIRLASLQRKRPEKAGARAAFIGDSVRRSLNRLGASGAPADRFSVAKEALQKASTEFHNMPLVHKRSFEQVAAASRRAKRCKVNQDIEELTDAIQTKRAKTAEQVAASPALRASLFGWSSHDLAHLDRMMQEGGFTRKFVASERELELHSPPVPPQGVRERMLQVDDGACEQSRVQCPSWVAGVCKSRGVFINVVLLFGEVADGVAFVLGYGSQNPYWAVFSRLRLVVVDGAPVANQEPGDRPHLAEHKFVFSVGHTEYFYEDHPLLVAPPRFVLPGSSTITNPHPPVGDLGPGWPRPKGPIPWGPDPGPKAQGPQGLWFPGPLSPKALGPDA